MPYSTHDVGLVAFVINGVAHGLAIDGQGFVLGCKSVVPLLQRTVKHARLNSYKHIADGGLAGYNIAAIYTPTA